MRTKICKGCFEELPIKQFASAMKNGREYRQSRCNSCRALSGQVLQDRRRNRAISALLRWPVPASAPADDPGHPSPGDTSLAAGALDLNGRG